MFNGTKWTNSSFVAPSLKSATTTVDVSASTAPWTSINSYRFNECCMIYLLQVRLINF
jgi:hypothetical protein